MCYHGNWGTICNEGGFGLSAASVACYQLGYSRTNASVQYDMFYISKNGPIWLSNVNCNGKESNLNNCTHLPIGQVSSSCIGHSQDVILTCQSILLYILTVHYCIHQLQLVPY